MCPSVINSNKMKDILAQWNVYSSKDYRHLLISRIIQYHIMFRNVFFRSQNEHRLKHDWTWICQHKTNWHPDVRLCVIDQFRNDLTNESAQRLYVIRQ